MTEALQLEIRTLRSLHNSERDPEGRVFAPLADAHRRAGQIPEAMRLLEEGLTRLPNFVPGHVVAAQLYVEQGLVEEAGVAARRALELDPDNVNALRSLLHVLEDERHATEAKVVREHLIALEPDFAGERSVTAAPGDHSVGDRATGAASIELEDTLVLDAGRDAWEAVEETEPMEAADFGAAVAGFGLGTSSLVPSGPEEGGPERFEHEASASEVDWNLTLEPEPDAASDFAGAAALEESTGLAFAPSEPEEEQVFDLEALAPDEDDAGEGGPVDIGLLTLDASKPLEIDSASLPEVEPVLDLDALAPDEPEEPVLDMAALAPDEPEEPVLDVAALAPDEPEELVLDVAALAPDEPEEPVLDVAALAPDEPEEPVLDVAALAPDEPEEPVLDVAALAPDEPEELVLDVAALAPDEPEEPVLDMAALAPDEPEEPVLDMAALAPDEPEEPVLDAAALAPDEPEEPVLDAASIFDVAEEPVFDLDDLAPDAHAEGTPAAEETVDLPFLSPSEPDEVVIDLDALRPHHDEAGIGEEASPELLGLPQLPAFGAADADIPIRAAEAGEEPTAFEESEEEGEAVSERAADRDDEDVEDGEPVYSRTLAELYVKQGAVERALRVLRHLSAADPGDRALADRIAELEASGEGAALAPAEEPAGARRAWRPDERDVEEPEGEADEEVEFLARDLAQSGDERHDVDSPFSWGEREREAPADGPSIRDYFDGLLSWEPGEDR